MDQYSNDPEFCQWYSQYPVKKGKAAALKSWRRIKNRPPVDELLRILEDQKENDIKWKQGYIPHPTTYLNQRRYEDETQVTTPTRTETAIDRAKAAIQQRRNNDIFVDALSGTLW